MLPIITVDNKDLLLIDPDRNIAYADGIIYQLQFIGFWDIVSTINVDPCPSVLEF